MPSPMSTRWLTTAALVLSLAACDSLAPPPTVDDAVDAAAVPPRAADRIAADVGMLADDLLEGREAGTRGYDLAALYVASRFRALGLEPAGDDGSYYQQVPLLQAERLREDARLVIHRGDAPVALNFLADFLPGVSYHAASHRLTAPAVFVGQAVHAPELGHDDFAGVDVAGKIAVVLGNAPASFPNDQRAFYASSREKAAELARRGAVGMILVSDPEREAKYPWLITAANWPRPHMRLVGADGEPVDTFPELRAQAVVNATAATQLFDGAPQSADEVFDRVARGELTAFDLPGEITLSGRTRLTRIDSRNVVARLPGGDVSLRDESVVFSAHLDHVGIGAPERGDAIYNGAMDNALGVSVMLEAAHQLVSMPAPAKRSMVFLAVTAEEKGLLGAEWFATHPTVPRAGIVANVNMDMPVLLGELTDAVPIGVEHSTLQPLVEQAAREAGVTLSPDPFPDEVVFIRSDQYAFIRQGIPAVYLDGGIVAADPAQDGAAMLRGFLHEHYHRPSDDTSLPIHYPTAAKLATLNARIGRAIADAAERPRWNEGDFFGERFAAGARQP